MKYLKKVKLKLRKRSVMKRLKKKEKLKKKLKKKLQKNKVNKQLKKKENLSLIHI